MKRTGLTIKARITLWYAAGLLAVCLLAMLALAAISDQAAESYYSDTLESAAVIMLDEMEVEHGLLEIDDDLEDVPNVYASLFELDGRLIYGRKRVEADFAAGEVRLVEANGHQWYIHDTRIAVPGREDVWMRLHMSSDATAGVYRFVMHAGTLGLPLLALLALAGGYALTVRAFRPVKRMSELAASIADGGDLSGRIVLPQTAGRDELHALGDTFNDMLARLEQAFVHERQFTSDAAHELRTPLNAMRMQGEYALSRTDAAQKDEAIGRMLEKNEEMQALVSQLLLIARMESGQMQRGDVCDLALLLQEIAEDMSPVAQERDMTIRTELENCRAACNRPMLTRAVVNLIDNAVRYGNEGGSITLSLTQRDGHAVIAVQDDGPGMDEETATRVFERFWRGDAARSTVGTGIGLSIVQAIARAHGGYASVSSRPGEGSRFALEIPANPDLQQ